MADKTVLTNPVPGNADTLVVPKDVAPSGHGGSGVAPVPHPLTPEANKGLDKDEVENARDVESSVRAEKAKDVPADEGTSDLSNPDNNVIDPKAKS